MTEETEFNLSKLIIKIVTLDGEQEAIIVSNVKEFIKRQIERMDLRIEELSEFDGLAEAMLQKAELRKVRNDLLKDAGDKLKGASNETKQ